MGKTGIQKFFSFVAETRRELDRVTWSTRKEVVITTIVVFVIALVASLFFALVDTMWYRIVHFLIGT
ncbi:MAG: preprotein translocase subunit SecE [Holosporales bacterium]|nr:preprotein translocase subunit SecE [Holosporales bacterium]